MFLYNLNKMIYESSFQVSNDTFIFNLVDNNLVTVTSNGNLAIYNTSNNFALINQINLHI